MTQKQFTDGISWLQKQYNRVIPYAAIESMWENVKAYPASIIQPANVLIVRQCTYLPAIEKIESYWSAEAQKIEIKVERQKVYDNRRAEPTPEAETSRRKAMEEIYKILGVFGNAEDVFEAENLKIEQRKEVLRLQAKQIMLID